MLELVEDQVVDDELLGVLGELVEEGFTLALDNFAYWPELEPLLRLASVAKLDIQALDHVGPEGRILRTVLAYERHRDGRPARLNARRAPARQG